jgi:hypothetical protein
MNHLPVGVLVDLVRGEAGRLVVRVGRVELPTEEVLILLLPLLDEGEALGGGVDEVGDLVRVGVGVGVRVRVRVGVGVRVRARARARGEMKSATLLSRRGTIALPRSARS